MFALPNSVTNKNNRDNLQYSAVRILRHFIGMEKNEGMGIKDLPQEGFVIFHVVERLALHLRLPWAALYGAVHYSACLDRC